MHPTDEPHRQKRSHLKVRTGCATCKTRRVKCDEVHPVCGRCRIANRKCIYAVPKTWLFEPKKESSALKPPPTVKLGSPQEQRAFHFFREKTAPQFAGNHAHAQNFWHKYVANTAVDDPLIFKLAVAMGARHEAAMYNSGESSVLATNCHASAITTLARSLTSMRVDLSLLCCGMLMGYANLCEQVPATAAIHFGLGLRILREETIQGPRNISDSIGAYLDPMFAELELATAIFRAPSGQIDIVLPDADANPPPSPPILPIAFQNLYEAKNALASVFRWGLYIKITCGSTFDQYNAAIVPQIDQLANHWHQLLIMYTANVASKDVLAFSKARKMLFQYKLFVMCRAAAKTAMFNDVCRVHMISVDFTRPDVTSILCKMINYSSSNDWTPLGKLSGHDRDDLDIWPQGEPAGQDGNNQIIRITLGA